MCDKLFFCIFMSAINGVVEYINFISKTIYNSQLKRLKNLRYQIVNIKSNKKSTFEILMSYKILKTSPYHFIR